MEFMLLFVKRQDAPESGSRERAEMKQFAGELARQGKLRRGAPLVDHSASLCIRLRAGNALVTDGPFAESKEILGGFCIVEVADRAEAVDIASRSPHARHGIVEVHRVRWRDVAADEGNGTPFLFVFRVGPGLGDPDGAKLREMIAYGETLKRENKFLETAPLVRDVPPARIEMRGAKVLVTDGPFAESKEAVGGYSVLRLANRAEALEIGMHYPHAKWGPIEIREIGDFDPT